VQVKLSSENIALKCDGEALHRSSRDGGYCDIELRPVARLRFAGPLMITSSGIPMLEHAGSAGPECAASGSWKQRHWASELLASAFAEISRLRHRYTSLRQIYLAGFQTVKTYSPAVMGLSWLALIWRFGERYVESERTKWRQWKEEAARKGHS
jgi:hypothetical protein